MALIFRAALREQCAFCDSVFLPICTIAGFFSRTKRDLPGGPIDHDWTKSLVASGDGMEEEKDRAAIWEVDRASGRWRIFASSPQRKWTELGAGERRAMGCRQRTRRTRSRSRARLYDVGEGRWVLCLAQ